MDYAGQSSRDLQARCKEQCRYVTTNIPRSAYARSLHILNNGPSHSTDQLVKPDEKGKKCYCSDGFSTQKFHQRNLLIPERFRSIITVLPGTCNQ